MAKSNQRLQQKEVSRASIENAHEDPTLRQVDRSNYLHGYDTAERFVSYFHQIEMVRRCQPRSVLEVGSGIGVVRSYLKSVGIQANNVDLDLELAPDIVGALPHLPFQSDSFDTVLCAQVLEHLPFALFEDCLLELARISRDYVVVSLPNSSWYVKVLMKFSANSPGIKVFFPVRRLIGFKHTFDGQHYWELGRKGTTARRIRKAMQDYFTVLEDCRLFDNPYHHFFLLGVKHHKSE